MSKENLKIGALTTREILMFLVDFAIGVYSITEYRRRYRKSIEDYWRWREFDHDRFNRNIYRLKQNKIIKVYQDGKTKYIELTPKGLKRIKKLALDDLKIEKLKVWDQKWRIVIFDIPSTKKLARDIFRGRLTRLGFIAIQKSVFVCPYECKQVIDYVVDVYSIRPYIKYIIADVFEGDTKLIKKFIDKDILEFKMISKRPEL